jgi:glycosyltransferase involved in cell wall biosynthesis
LVLTQSVPAFTGHGASMRIGAAVQALTRWARVHLLIVTELPRADLSLMPSDLTQACEKVTFVQLPPLGRGRRRSWKEPDELVWGWDDLWPALRAESARGYDHLHVFRLRLMPVWEGLRRLGWSASRLVLDLDDIESRAVWRGVLVGHRRLGVRTSGAQAIEAARLRLAENRAARLADVVLACSQLDRDELARRWPGSRVEVVPNVVPLRETSAADLTGPLRLLFVGSLFYQPNVDAVMWIVDKLVPALTQAGLDYQLTVAGRSPPAELAALVQKAPGCELLADAPDLAPVYEACQVVLCPIQSGGGTRIKVLEALSFARPVVSTRIGAEGLTLRHEVDVLYAESADEFVRQLQRLRSDHALAGRLAHQGLARVRDEYSLEALQVRLMRAHGAAQPA